MDPCPECTTAPFERAQQNTLASTLQKAHFKIQNLEEARQLALFISHSCPRPTPAAVGINELLINAIEHGNLNIKYHEKTRLHSRQDWLLEVQRRLALPENQNKFISVAFEKTASVIALRIEDEGEGFDWRSYQQRLSKGQQGLHGRGILIAQLLAFDELHYSKKGNVAHGLIRLPTHPVPPR